MFLGSKVFRILLISCVQQADGSDFGSGPEQVDVFVVDSRYFEWSAGFAGVSRTDVSCADYTCDASSHVLANRDDVWVLAEADGSHSLCPARIGLNYFLKLY